MKKLFTFLLLFSIITISYSQTMHDSIKNVSTIQEVERVVDKYSEKVGDWLTMVAEKLEVPAEEVWKIMITQQYVFAITHSIIIFLLIFIGILVWFVTPEDVLECIWGLPLCFNLVTLIYIIAIAYDVIGCYVNPEYYAIQDILVFII